MPFHVAAPAFYFFHTLSRFFTYPGARLSTMVLTVFQAPSTSLPWLAHLDSLTLLRAAAEGPATSDFSTSCPSQQKSQTPKTSPFPRLLLHNGIMRKIPIVIAAGFAISGAVLAAFSTPPYSLQMPSIVERSKGEPVTVTVRAWNLRPREATITYIGDCCSLESSVILPPFSTQTFSFTLNKEKLPAHSINKTASFSFKSGSDSFVKGFPYYLKVSRS